ncbi:MAG: SMC-Scp complex subunit ScpB [Terracidiphilus sp.]
MSLKAKLEAVIYAAEEPVTLAQLAALFASEALEWKAEEETAAEEAAAEAAEQARKPEQLPMLAEGLEYLGLEQAPDFYNAEEAAGASVQVDPALSNLAGTEPGESSTAIPSGESAAAETAEPQDSEAEAKRLARVRDREGKAILRKLLDELIATYAVDDRGVEIREIAGGFRMATKPACHDAVRVFIKSLKPAMKLSLPALETLAVIAYKQPVTAPEVNEIRGVDSSGVFGSLLSRKLITTAGRKQVIGRPILYKTTKEFLLRFGLNDVTELPSMDEFEKMASVELNESSETEDENVGGPNGGPDLDENASEEEPGENPPSASLETVAPQSEAQGEVVPPPESSAPHEKEEAETAHHD